jgi:hypothetical protein
MCIREDFGRDDRTSLLEQIHDAFICYGRSRGFLLFQSIPSLLRTCGRYERV